MHCSLLHKSNWSKFCFYSHCCSEIYLDLFIATFTTMAEWRLCFDLKSDVSVALVYVTTSLQDLYPERAAVVCVNVIALVGFSVA